MVTLSVTTTFHVPSNIHNTQTIKAIHIKPKANIHSHNYNLYNYKLPLLNDMSHEYMF
jgi:hypothetical protein